MVAVAHSKHRRGCDCLNETESVGDGLNPGRCEHCDESGRNAVCAYVAHFDCEYWTGLGTTREKFTEPCLVLRKDCLYGCTYSSRWYCENYDPVNDRPKIRYPNCGVVGTSGARCPVCRTVRCIEGTIFRMVFPDPYDPSTYNCFGPPLNPDLDLIDGDTELRFQLVYLGAEVTTERDEYYAGSCMWSGIAIQVSTGQPLLHMPIFLDLIDGQFRLRIYWPEPSDRWYDGCVPPPESTSDLLGMNRVDIYLPYSDCDSIEDVTYSGDSPGANHPSATYSAPATPGFEVNIGYWSRNDSCPPLPFINIGDCTWAQEPCAGPDTCDTSEEPTGAYDTYADSADSCFTKWRLTITSSTTAELDLTTREGFFAHYTCNNFNCYDRSTFTMAKGAYDPVTNPTGAYSPEVIGLPECLCVSPLKSTSGGCVNSGLQACCDSGGPVLPVRVTIRNCNNELVYNDEWVSFTRGGPLPCGVNTPFPYDDCLYFKAQITVEEDCADWGGDLFILMYCSEAGEPAVTPPCTGWGFGPGNERYNFVFYCLNLNTGCWEEQGGFCENYECTCQGPWPAALSYTKPCCCPTGCCEGVTLPSTLYASDESGNTVTLTYDSGRNLWAGNIPVGMTWGGCSAYLDIVEVTFTQGNDGCCTFEHSSPLISCPGGCDCNAPTSCNPFSWNSDGVCCAGYPSDCGDPFIVTITE